MCEGGDVCIPTHPELLSDPLEGKERTRSDAHIQGTLGLKGFLLETNVTETRLCEHIKLERRSVRWRLLPHAVIQRVLLRDLEDPDASGDNLIPHDVKSLTIGPLRHNKFHLIEDVFDDSTLLLRKVTWSIRFSSPDEALNWYNILQLIHRPSVPPPIRLPPQTTIRKTQSNILSLPKVSASLPVCGAASVQPFPARRVVVLRGTVEKKQVNRLQDLSLKKWQPVTWIAYSDGTLEEYAKNKRSHELLTTYRLADCSIRSVPLPYTIPSVFVHPDQYLHISSQNMALELYKKLTGRVDLYRIPNKLLQIQWLAVLTNLSISSTAVRPGPLSIKATASEPTRFPAKVSILKEKRLVDIFGVVVPLWVSVVWDYDEKYGVRRRYHKSLSQSIAKPVEPLQPLPNLSTSTLVIPWSTAKVTAPATIPKSNRRFAIRSTGNDQDIGVLTQSPYERDEWLAVLLQAKNKPALKSSQSEPAASALVKPSQRLPATPGDQEKRTFPLSSCATASKSESSIKSREKEALLDDERYHGDHLREVDSKCGRIVYYRSETEYPSDSGDELSRLLPVVIVQ